MPRLVLIIFPGCPDWALLAAAANCCISKQQLVTQCHWEPWVLAPSLTDRAAGQEMPDDISITWQATAEIIGISFSPWSFYNFLKALSIYSIRLLLIFRDTTVVRWKAVTRRKL